MAKRLASSGRQKLEKEVCHNLRLLSDNTSECEDYIAELEALLRQQKSSEASAQAALAGAENKLAQAMGRIEAQKDDIQTMRTDAKLAALQQSTTDKELSQLHSQLQDALNDGQAFSDDLRDQLAAEKKAFEAERQRRDAADKALAEKHASETTTEKARRDAVERELSGKLGQTEKELEAEAKARTASEKARAEEAKANEELKEELEALHVTINEYRECDKALRERIAILEQLLSEERKKAGQDLLLRIMELETMLEAERNKVDDLDELPTVVHVSHSSAEAPKMTKKTTTTTVKTSNTSQKTSKGGKG